MSSTVDLSRLHRVLPADPLTYHLGWFSPDGGQIIFRAMKPGEAPKVFVQDVDGNMDGLGRGGGGLRSGTGRAASEDECEDNSEAGLEHALNVGAPLGSVKQDTREKGDGLQCGLEPDFRFDSLAWDSAAIIVPFMTQTTCERSHAIEGAWKVRSR